EDDRLLAGNVGAGILQERAGAVQADDLGLRGAERVAELADRDDIALIDAVDDDIGLGYWSQRQRDGNERRARQQARTHMRPGRGATPLLVRGSIDGISAHTNVLP